MQATLVNTGDSAMIISTASHVLACKTPMEPDASPHIVSSVYPFIFLHLITISDAIVCFKQMSNRNCNMFHRPLHTSVLSSLLSIRTLANFSTDYESQRQLSCSISQIIFS